jgi:hypothetical protein
MAHHGLHSRRVYRFAGLLLSSLFIGAEAAAAKNCEFQKPSAQTHFVKCILMFTGYF